MVTGRDDRAEVINVEAHRGQVALPSHDADRTQYRGILGPEQGPATGYRMCWSKGKSGWCSQQRWTLTIPLPHVTLTATESMTSPAGAVPLQRHGLP